MSVTSTSNLLTIFINNAILKLLKKLEYFFFRSYFKVWLFTCRERKLLDKLKRKGWVFSSIREVFEKIEDVIREIMRRLVKINTTVPKFREEVNKDPLLFMKKINFLLDMEGLDCWIQSIWNFWRTYIIILLIIIRNWW